MYIDDASYSGRQIETHLDLMGMPSSGDGQFPEGVQMHLVVPFMTRHAAELMKNKYRNVSVSQHRTVLSVEDIIKQGGIKSSDVSLLKRAYGLNEETLKENGLTYFAHKIPDMSSVPGAEATSIFDGVVVDVQGNKIGQMPFIPKTVPPYKEQMLAEVFRRWMKE